MKLFKRILLVPAAIKWVKALELVAACKYHEAVVLLESLREKMGKSPEFYVLIGFAKFAGSADAEAYRELDSARTVLDVNNKYSAADKLYLRAYISWIQCKILQHRGDWEAGDKCLAQVPWDTIDLNSVQKAIKLNFPLRSHPRWERDEGS